jgi:hypothetical protein
MLLVNASKLVCRPSNWLPLFTSSRGYTFGLSDRYYPFYMFLLSFSVRCPFPSSSLCHWSTAFSLSSLLLKKSLSSLEYNTDPFIYTRIKEHTRHATLLEQRQHKKLIEESIVCQFSTIDTSSSSLFSLLPCMDGPHVAGNNNADGSETPPRHLRCEILCRILSAWFCCDCSERKPKRNRPATPYPWVNPWS